VEVVVKLSARILSGDGAVVLSEPSEQVNVSGISDIAPLVEAARRVYEKSRRVATTMELTEQEWQTIRLAPWFRSLMRYTAPDRGCDADAPDENEELKALAYLLGVSRYVIHGAS
jgi:hypothetical protein